MNQQLKQKGVISKGYSASWGYGYGFIVVVSDQMVDGLELDGTSLVIHTKEETTEELARELIKLAGLDLCEKREEGYPLSNIIVRGQEKTNNNGFITISSFVCFYVAFIFTAVVGAILAIQSLSDSTKYKYRYQVLSKLGVRNEQIYHTIFKQ